MNNNGHHKLEPNDLMGDESFQRSDMIMIRKAIREGWDIDDRWLKQLPRAIAEVVANKDEQTRDRLRAVELLVKMKSDNTANLLDGIKVERLINGDSTENVNVVKYTIVERGSIINDRLDDD